MHKPKIYIAGPMRGYPNYNFPAFDAARDLWISAGWDVVNPADLDRDIGFDPTKDEVDKEFLDKVSRRDLEGLMMCDAIYMLDGWEDSVGARAERAVAEWRQMEIYELGQISVMKPGQPGRSICTPNQFRRLKEADAKMSASIQTARAEEDNPTSRKQTPVYSGVLNYFPDAIREVAKCSFVGNEQHNPGTELHWDRDKSGDELDALSRHLLDAGSLDSDGVRHSAKVAWRALANLQKELENDGP